MNVSIDALVVSPGLALIPALGFASLYTVYRRRLVAGAATMWVLYFIHEYGMHRRWFCSGECNIRIDLLLIYPVMVLVSVSAAIAGVIALVRRRRAS